MKPAPIQIPGVSVDRGTMCNIIRSGRVALVTHLPRELRRAFESSRAIPVQCESGAVAYQQLRTSMLRPTAMPKQFEVRAGLIPILIELLRSRSIPFEFNDDSQPWPEIAQIPVEGLYGFENFELLGAVAVRPETLVIHRSELLGRMVAEVAGFFYSRTIVIVASRNHDCRWALDALNSAGVQSCWVTSRALASSDGHRVWISTHVRMGGHAREIEPR